jgi:hypothetical protein
MWLPVLLVRTIGPERRWVAHVGNEKLPDYEGPEGV